MRLFIAAVLLVGSFGALAADGEDRRPLALSAIAEQQNQIRAEVVAGEGRYRDMSPAKREALLARQSRLLAMISGRTSTDDLSERQRIEAFNTLEWIQATINNEDDERLICRREKTIGSNRTTRVCRTAADERRYLEEARERMQRGDPMGRH